MTPLVNSRMVCGTNLKGEDSMAPAGASPTIAEEARLLEQISDLRDRVRTRHREHALWAALVGLVAVGGAVAFLLGTQIRWVSCHPFEQAGVVCDGGERSFNLWWYWPLAAAAVLVFALARRHRRGTWRMTPVGWLVAALVLIFVLPTVLSLLPALAPPVSYPLAAVAALAALAVSRRSALGVVAAVAAVTGVLLVEFRLGALTAMDEVQQVLLTNNLGWALSSLLVGVAALLTAGTWTVSRRR